MPTKPGPGGPETPQTPAAVKAVAMIGWYCLVGLLLWRGEINADKALVAGGAPLGLVMGFRVGELLRAILVKR